MGTFIEDYLHNPSLAILTAKNSVDESDRFDNINEDDIYAQLSSGEFRLYEEIIVSTSAEDSPRAENYAVVA